jgi:hypothetical protein
MGRDLRGDADGEQRGGVISSKQEISATQEPLGIRPNGKYSLVRSDWAWDERAAGRAGNILPELATGLVVADCGRPHSSPSHESAWPVFSDAEGAWPPLINIDSSALAASLVAPPTRDARLLPNDRRY